MNKVESRMNENGAAENQTNLDSNNNNNNHNRPSSSTRIYQNLPMYTRSSITHHHHSSASFSEENNNNSYDALEERDRQFATAICECVDVITFQAEVLISVFNLFHQASSPPFWQWSSYWCSTWLARPPSAPSSSSSPLSSLSPFCSPVFSAGRRRLSSRMVLETFQSRVQSALTLNYHQHIILPPHHHLIIIIIKHKLHGQFLWSVHRRHLLKAFTLYVRCIRGPSRGVFHRHHHHHPLKKSLLWVLYHLYHHHFHLNHPRHPHHHHHHRCHPFRRYRVELIHQLITPQQLIITTTLSDIPPPLLLPRFLRTHWRLLTRLRVRSCSTVTSTEEKMIKNLFFFVYFFS